MEKRRRILLFGDSIILGTIEANLRRFSDYDVAFLLRPLPVLSDLKALKPDVILFDLETASPQSFLPFLAGCPGVRLIGVSPDDNLVKVWSGRELRELSMQDLMQVIDDQLRDLPYL